MSEQNETNETSEDQDIKRWTATRRAALVIKILRGQTTFAEAAHPRASMPAIKTFEQAKAAIEVWVTFYNTKLPHQALNYRSPAQHRAAHTLLHVA
jgi:transposase InsO family protein